eukprot:s2011_g8.t1
MAASLVLVQFLIHFIRDQPQQLEQLREMCCNILRACGLPLFLTSIEIAWVHITMAQIVESQHDGTLLPSTLTVEKLPKDIDVTGAAPCRQPGNLHVLRDLPYAPKLKEEIPNCLATVCRMMQSPEFLALREPDRNHVEKHLLDWMFLLQTCFTVLESDAAAVAWD